VSLRLVEIVLVHQILLVKEATIIALRPLRAGLSHLGLDERFRPERDNDERLLRSG